MLTSDGSIEAGVAERAAALLVLPAGDLHQACTRTVTPSGRAEKGRGLAAEAHHHPLLGTGQPVIDLLPLLAHRPLPGGATGGGIAQARSRGDGRHR